MNDAKTIGSNALVLDTAEENVTVMNAEESELGKEVSLIEQRAEAVVVASGADFEDAGLFLKQIKQAQKQVKDYWEPLRVSAKKSYDEVLNHRKEMIEPLEKAEKIVKVKVNEYSAEQERKRREQEEAMRRLAQAEIDRHLNEAAEAEAILQSFGAWDAHAAYGDTHELRAKYAKKVEAIIGEPVEIHRKLNGNRAVRDKRRLRQCRNLYKKQHQNRETEKSGSFSYAQRPTDVPPWADS